MKNFVIDRSPRKLAGFVVYRPANGSKGLLYVPDGDLTSAPESFDLPESFVFAGRAKGTAVVVGAPKAPKAPRSGRKAPVADAVLSEGIAAADAGRL